MISDFISKGPRRTQKNKAQVIIEWLFSRGYAALHVEHELIRNWQFFYEVWSNRVNP